MRLIRVDPDDRVVAVARVPSAREEREANGVEAEPPPEPEDVTGGSNQVDALEEHEKPADKDIDEPHEA